jgi:hypothetical protein
LNDGRFLWSNTTVDWSSTCLRTRTRTTST